MIFQYPKLVLASASPRRREILAGAGLHFEVLSTSVDERQLSAESPDALVRRLAAAKAAAASQAILNDARLAELRGLPILGADTIVVIDGRVLGKPASDEEARQMLRLLAGRTHQVLTGVALLFNSVLQMEVEVATTEVEFRALDDAQISGYVQSGEPRDKAGAYGIQGFASKFVTRIAGCYFNVVGLPIALVCQMLERQRDLPG